MNFKSVEEILEFAINEEKKAANFYSELAKQVDNSATQKMLNSFAEEERGHQKKLENIKAGQQLNSINDKVQDLKISDYMVDVEVRPEMPLQDILIVAMKKEKAAFKLYTNLADVAPDSNLRNMLQELAVEESKHKLKFEVMYDEKFMTEN